MRVGGWSSETCCALPSPLPSICPLTPLPTNTHLINGPGSLITSWILIDLHQFVSHQGFPEQRCLRHIIHNIYALLRLEKQPAKCLPQPWLQGWKTQSSKKQEEKAERKTEGDRTRLMIKGDGFKWWCGHAFLSMLVMWLLTRKLVLLIALFVH